MSGPSIAPLARRLAEENNVDWRALGGTGEGGRVVERDVLGYLAQVMRGEAATDPTPEPLPEGLEAWSEEQGRSSGTAQLDAELQKPQQELQKEAGSFWTFGPPADPPAEPQVEATAPQAFTFEPPPEVPLEPPEAGRSVMGEGEPWSGSGGRSGGVDSDGNREDGEDENGHEDAEVAPSAVPESLYKTVLDEVQTLRTRLAQLEEERRRHLEELHQLARLQETIAAQRAEQERANLLKREVDGLKEALADARSEAERAAALEASLQDREARLERARRFKAKVKTEMERLLGYAVQLEDELSALRARPRWKFWG